MKFIVLLLVTFSAFSLQAKQIRKMSEMDPRLTYMRAWHWYFNPDELQRRFNSTCEDVAKNDDWSQFCGLECFAIDGFELIKENNFSQINLLAACTQDGEKSFVSIERPLKYIPSQKPNHGLFVYEHRWQSTTSRARNWLNVYFNEEDLINNTILTNSPYDGGSINCTNDDSSQGCGGSGTPAGFTKGWERLDRFLVPNYGLDACGLFGTLKERLLECAREEFRRDDNHDLVGRFPGIEKGDLVLFKQKYVLTLNIPLWKEYDEIESKLRLWSMTDVKFHHTFIIDVEKELNTEKWKNYPPNVLPTLLQIYVNERGTACARTNTGKNVLIRPLTWGNNAWSEVELILSKECNTTSRMSVVIGELL